MRSDLLGWTFAELALALLFALLAVFTPSYWEASTKSRKLEERERAMTQQAEVLRRQEQELRMKFEASRRDLRSRLTPPCSELDKGNGVLFTATILSANLYEIDGRKLNIDEIRGIYSREIGYADRMNCRQRVRVAFEPGLSAEAFDTGKRRLDSIFYASSVGSR